MTGATANGARVVARQPAQPRRRFSPRGGLQRALAPSLGIGGSRTTCASQSASPAAKCHPAVNKTCQRGDGHAEHHRMNRLRIRRAAASGVRADSGGPDHCRAYLPPSCPQSAVQRHFRVCHAERRSAAVRRASLRLLVAGAASGDAAQATPDPEPGRYGSVRRTDSSVTHRESPLG
jgi:hypothetical protein